MGFASRPSRTSRERARPLADNDHGPFRRKNGHSGISFPGGRPGVCLTGEGDSLWQGRQGRHHGHVSGACPWEAPGPSTSDARPEDNKGPGDSESRRNHLRTKYHYFCNVFFKSIPYQKKKKEGGLFSSLFWNEANSKYQTTKSIKLNQIGSPSTKNWVLKMLVTKQSREVIATRP